MKKQRFTSGLEKHFRNIAFAAVIPISSIGFPGRGNAEVIEIESIPVSRLEKENKDYYPFYVDIRGDGNPYSVRLVHKDGERFIELSRKGEQNFLSPIREYKTFVSETDFDKNGKEELLIIEYKEGHFENFSRYLFELKDEGEYREGVLDTGYVAHRFSVEPKPDILKTTLTNRKGKIKTFYYQWSDKEERVVDITGSFRKD